VSPPTRAPKRPKAIRERCPNDDLGVSLILNGWRDIALHISPPGPALETAAIISNFVDAASIGSFAGAVSG
jgi:hypothetical protein